MRESFVLVSLTWKPFISRLGYKSAFRSAAVLVVFMFLLRWLKADSSTFQDVDFDGSYYHSLEVDATIMVSKNCPITGEHVGVIFVAC